MYLKVSYEQQFDDLMMHLRSKYPEKLFDMDGIGKQTDMSLFSKEFFAVKTTADVSVDANANVEDMSVITYNTELPKPFFKLNSYFILWKYMKRLFGHETANKVVEMQLTGDIYINDFHGIAAGAPYSYHPHTTICVKEDGVIKLVTLESLFAKYDKNKVTVPTHEEINTGDGQLFILDEGNVFVPLTRVLRHKPDTPLYKLETKDGCSTIVTADHPVILADGSEKRADELTLDDCLKRSEDVLPTVSAGVVDLDRAYLMGFFLGDGFATVNGVTKTGSSRRGKVSIRQNDIINTKVYRCLTSLFDNVQIYKGGTEAQCNCRDTAEAWRLLGVGSNNKKVPEDILTWGEQGIKAFIAGLIDSDGCINPLNGIVTIRVTSFALVQQVAELLRGLCSGKVRTYFTGRYTPRENSYKSNHELFCVSVRLSDPDYIKYSDKVSAKQDLVYKSTKKDGRYESSKLHRIEVFTGETEYVYDVTTLTGQFRSQGLIQHNCFNYSTYDIMLLGLPMVKKIKSTAPQYLYSFKSQLEQFVVIASNSTLGATGLADLLIVMSYYVSNILKTGKDAHFSLATEEDRWLYIKENLVSFIYTINQPMRANQSPFTNISLFDQTFLESLCPNYIFPDGSTPDVGLVQKLQILFMDIMNEEMKRTPITFPVTTACFSVDDEGNILDGEFAELIAEKNLEYGFINMYCGKSSTLSSCCFIGEQKVLVRDSKNGVRSLPIKEYASTPWADKVNTTVFHDGAWVKSKTVTTNYTGKLYTIFTSNKKKMIVTADHSFPTSRGNVCASELTTDDFLLFNSSTLEPSMESTKDLSYKDGLLIGAYLGDGSIYYKKDVNSVEVTMSVTEKKLERLKFLRGWHNYESNNNVIFAKSYDKSTAERIEKWVETGHANEKRLKLSVLDQPSEFRKGILAGLYATDGGNSNRIYTTSPGLAEDLEILITSLGMHSILDVTDRTHEPVVIRGEEFKRNRPLYCIRWYTPKNQRSQKEVYKKRNGSTYFKIGDISTEEVENEPVYCFEVRNDDEPYFTLPSGVITHNCRLRSETDNEYFNSFGSGSSKIGSLGVCTINLPRLAAKCIGNEDKFHKELADLVEVCAKVNHTKRHVIKSRIENGNLPLYSLGYMGLGKQYSTVGVNGLNEACELMGYNILQESGQSFVLHTLGTINSSNEFWEKRYKTPHNCEQIPGENSSIKLADKDRLLGYTDYPIYSNQFIPLVTEADMLDRIRLQGMFDKHFSGGAICHLNVEEKITDPKHLVDLIKFSAKMGVVYFAVNYLIQRCENDHMTVGNNKVCPVCGEGIKDQLTRVVGFLTSVKNWHKVRREQDFPHRQFYQGI